MQRPLADFYHGWDRFQDLLVEAIAPLAPEQLALAVAPGQRPANEIAAHIAEARAFWFGAVLGAASDTLAPLAEWEDLAKAPRDATRLVDALRLTWGVVAERLAAWTPGMLDDTFTAPAGELPTRQWVIWHVLEHDLAHGGEIFLTLGSHGLATPEL